MRALLLTVALGLGALGALNRVIDPYALWGGVRVHGVNDVNPRGLGSLPRRATLSLLLGVAEAHPEPVVLLGTSHVRDGLETCHDPRILRLAVSGLSLQEADLLLETLTRDVSTDRTFLLEAVPPGPGTAGVVHTPIETPRALFSIDATRRSLRTFSASRRMASRTDRAPPGCMVPPRGDREAFPFADLEERAASLVTPLTPADLTRIGETVRTFRGYCTSRRHRLRLFLLPVSPALMEVPGVAEVIRSNAAALAGLVEREHVGGGGCPVSFMDLSEALPEVGRAPDFWYDPTHFAPQVGDTLLRRLLVF